MDLKDGFHHVKIKDQDQKYIVIKWRGILYAWQRLPFGVKCAPFYFNKIIRPVVSFLRSRGLRNAIFVDDLLGMSVAFNALKDVDFTVSVFQRLGWLVNFQKSALEPSESCDYIGFTVYSNGPEGPWIKVKHNKIHKLRRHIRGALKAGSVQVRSLARIAGECVAMVKAVLPAKLLLRNIYRTIAKRSSWDSLVEITECKQDLLWWLHALANWNGAPIRQKEPELQLTTDASESGWGGFIGSQEAAGYWTNYFGQNYIIFQ